MLKENEIYTVKIESVNNMGNGVTHIDGIAVFVPYAVTGDECEIRLMRVHSSYAIASLLRICVPSTYRIPSGCLHFGTCGGCSYLELDIERENAEKREQVSATLKKFGIEAEVENTVCPVFNEYRNKVVLFYDNGSFGYYQQGTNKVVPHKRCIINDPIFDKIADFCLSTLDKKDLRALFIRKTSHKEPQIIVAPIYWSRADILQFSASLLDHFPEVVSVLYGVNREKSFAFENTTFHKIYGDGYIEDEMCGLEFRISPRSFYQINHSCATALYEKAISLLNAKMGDTVADLFCGTGTMGMIAAKRTGADVIGVEIEKSAVDDAKRNARLNGIRNIEFFADDAKNFNRSIDSCIIDPPRKGCSKFMIDTLLRLLPDRIVYVSCNPDTMARDINMLSDKYRISSPVSVFNMFPRTSHVESVVCLTRRLDN